jgi:hypothetical protein
METTINEKAMKAIESFLERRNYDILERLGEAVAQVLDDVSRAVRLEVLVDFELKRVVCDVLKALLVAGIRGGSVGDQAGAGDGKLTQWPSLS